MSHKQKLRYRENVRAKYLLPKLYQAGYVIDEIIENKPLIIEKGRRQVFITADVVIEIKGAPTVIVSVRHAGEDITEYNKEYLLSYARLLEQPAPVIMITNGIEDYIYNDLIGEKLTDLPRRDEIGDYILTTREISTKLKEEALDYIFQPISLWDFSKRHSPYHYSNMRAFDEDLKIPFQHLIYHGANYKPEIPQQQEVDIRVSSKRDLVDKIFLYYTTDGKLPKGKGGIAKNSYQVELSRDYSEALPGQEHLIDWWSAKIPAQKEGIVRYIIEGYNSVKGSSYYAESYEDLSNAKVFAYSSNDYDTPNWAKEALVYQILIDRFCDGNPSNNYDLGFTNTDFQGGDLQGVLEKLPYIKELGVDTIWLSPVFKGLSYHGYHITDFTEVDIRFGDKRLLKKMIDKAHKIGLKVILDFVPNHSSDKHPFFKEACNNKDSDYYNWYTFTDWPSEYDSFCGLKDLPKLNADNPQTREYLINQIIMDLVLNYKVDGLRMDHAYGISHDFWVELRQIIKSVASDVFLFGEIWEGPGVIKEYAGEFDGSLDFSLVWSFRELFIYGTKTVTEFLSDLYYLDQVYPDQFIIGRFLDNHDMSRFLWEAKGDKRRLKLAAICQFSLNGMQIIYYGTEVGLSQDKACFNDNTGDIIFDNSRKFMIWGSDRDNKLYYFYRKLCQLRKNHSILSKGQREVILKDDERKLLIYKKYDKENELLFVLNIADQFNKVNFETDDFDLADSKWLIDLISNFKYRAVAGRLQLKLNPLQGMILKKI